MQYKMVSFVTFLWFATRGLVLTHSIKLLISKTTAVVAAVIATTTALLLLLPLQGGARSVAHFSMQLKVVPSFDFVA